MSKDPLLFFPTTGPGSLPDTEIGRLFRQTDWSRTPLGAVEQWPQSLRLAVTICLNSRFPMFVWWGPALVNIYNDAYIPMLGKRHPHGFGRPARDSWSDAWPALAPQVDEVMQQGRASWNERVRLVLERNGFSEEAFFTWSYSPVYDERGGVGGLFCAVVEETQRIAAEREHDALMQRAQNTAEMLLAWFDHAPGFVAFLRGPDFVFEMVNKAYYQLVGERRLEGLPVFEALPDIRNQGLEEILDRVYRSGEPFIGRAVRISLRNSSDGPVTEAFLDFIYQPVFDAGGKVRGIFVQGQDVTRQVQALRALEQTDRRKDEFLATLAHELRNPLAPIVQAAQLAKKLGLPSAQHRWALDIIERQTQHLAALLDDLLDVSRISQGQLGLRPAPVTLSSVIEAAIETARPLIDAKQHRLSVALPDTPVVFIGDPLRLAQVVSNLLSNASKYTDAGGAIEVAAAVEAAQVVIRVRDNGIGLAPGSTQNIFEMFSQVTSALDRAEGGLGIGLALSRRLVEMHDGSIEAHSPGIGRGSEFVIRIPGISPQPLPLPVQAAGAPRLPPADPARILLADDNTDACASLAMLLELEGQEVHIATDGRQALAAAERLRPDVAVLDIGMPGLNGYEVAAAIRSASWGKTVALIALTGWGQAEDLARARAAGFDHHCTKPVDPEQLRRLIAMRTGAVGAGADHPVRHASMAATAQPPRRSEPRS